MVCLSVILFTMPAFSQQNLAPSASTNEQAPILKVDTPQPNETSISGEVQSVDAVTNSLTVKYYDYDSGQDKDIVIIVNKDTKIEHASSLTDIKKGDGANITYTVSDAKNIAKSMSIEKGEEPVETSADTE